MQELLTYLLKSSGLIITFFAAYYFLLRKETFFTSNRWFLLSGLISSVVFPLFFIKKIVLVDAPKISPIRNSISENFPLTTKEIIQQTTEINWLEIGFYVYGIIAVFLFLKIIFNLLSLYKVLDKNKIIKQKDIQFIDTSRSVSPFSFFNYIVINSSLYSESELQSILLHEKIHSVQKHSVDVLLTNLFSVVFWFNPFMHLYKKAVLQNLEFIADSEAIAQIDDKKAYQMALLKVVSNQNCLPITNHFYQSLIKKRIVMLNKNQSHRKNSWKYAVIIPALIAFLIFFQVKVIAQEKERKITQQKQSYVKINAIYIHKNSTDAEMIKDADLLKNDAGIDVKFSKIKRNSKLEIIAIQIDYEDKNGNKGKSFTNGDEPINTITIFKTRNSVGIKSDESENSKKTAIVVQGNSKNNVQSNEDEISDDEKVALVNSADYPVPPTPPTPPTPPSIVMNTNVPPIKFPTAPKAPSGTPLTNEKEWNKFEKKMDEFSKKMDAMSPEIEAYAQKMSNVEAQMKPFEEEMKVYEQKMKVYEKQMEEYGKKMETFYQKN